MTEFQWALCGDVCCAVATFCLFISFHICNRKLSVGNQLWLFTVLFCTGLMTANKLSLESCEGQVLLRENNTNRNRVSVLVSPLLTKMSWMSAIMSPLHDTTLNSESLLKPKLQGLNCEKKGMTWFSLEMSPFLLPTSAATGETKFVAFLSPSNRWHCPLMIGCENMSDFPNKRKLPCLCVCVSLFLSTWRNRLKLRWRGW